MEHRTRMRCRWSRRRLGSLSGDCKGIGFDCVGMMSVTMPRGFEGTFLRTMGRFSVCTVVNKFLIRVAYDADELARQFVEAADNPAVRAERACHFRNVARRCMLALLAIETFIDWPSLKSKDDLKDEEVALASVGGDGSEITL